MATIFIFAWLTVSTLGIALLFDREFVECLPIDIILAGFFLYFGGLLGNIRIGFYLTLLLPLLVFAFLIYKGINIKSIKNKIFKLSFLIYTIVFFVCTIYQWYASFKHWDEFMHWGPMVKEMFRLDQLYCVDESILSKHKDYPPLISLIELLWCYFHGTFEEAYCFRALTFFGFSLFLPLFKSIEFKIKDIFKAGLLFFSVALLFVIPFNYYAFPILEGIYTDAILGLFLAYVCYVVINYCLDDDTFNTFALTIVLTMLLMIKEISIALYLLSIFLIVFNSVGKDISWKSLLKKTMYFIVLPLTMLISWKLYYSQFSIEKQFSFDGQNLFEIPFLIFGLKGEEWQLLARNNFLDAVLNRQILAHANVSYILFVVITVIVLGIVLMNSKPINKQCKISILTTYFFGSFAYALLMLFLYMTSFGPVEGPTLASYERYMSTYLLFGVALVVYIVYGCGQHNKYMYLFMLIILLISAGTTGLKTIELNTEPSSVFAQEKYKELKLKLYEYVPKGSKILLLNCYHITQDKYLLSYNMGLDYYFDSIVIGETHYQDANDWSKIDMSQEEWLDYTSDFDYIYIDWHDEEFYIKHWAPFTDEPLWNLNLYKIMGNGEYCMIDGSNKCEVTK